jgi:tRNA A37 threonylcarbamoyladenosine modification protein TsaB
LANNMVLYINTTEKDQKLEIYIKIGQRTLFHKKLKAEFKQAEKLLCEIEKQFMKYKVKMKDIKEVRVKNSGGTFTSLRIGVVVANALAFALDIPVKNFDGKNIKKEKINLVKPEYNAEPSIN